MTKKFISVSLTLIFILVTLFSGSPVFAEDLSIETFPGKVALQKMIEKGILQGDGKGNYYLDKSMTRAEWLTILKRVARERELRYILPTVKSVRDPKLNTHWAKNEVVYWLERGIIQGTPEGNLRLDEPITLAELLVIYDRMMAQVPYDSRIQNDLDIFKGHWAYDSLNRLHKKGLVDFNRPFLKDGWDLNRHALRGEGIILLSPFYTDSAPSIPAIAPSLKADGLNQTFDLNKDGKIDFSFRIVDPGITYGLQHVTVTQYTYLDESEWTYSIFSQSKPVGTLSFQLKWIEGKELAYFIRYKPSSTLPKPLMLDLVAYGDTVLQGRTPVSRIGEEEVPYEWKRIDIAKGDLVLSGGSLYLDGKDVSFRVGPTDTFKELGYTVREHMIHQQSISVIKSLEDVHIIRFSFAQQPGTFTETWGILGDKTLFAWNRPEFAKHMLREDISINRKLSMEGLFYRLPYNYVPYHKNGFYLNPANIYGLNTLSIMSNQHRDGRILQDLALMIGYMSLSRQNQQGYWPTAPASKWLEKDYGIGYNYYDNRRNADQATFLLELYRKYPDEKFRNALNKHVQFLYGVIEPKSIKTSKQGLLYTDYSDFRSDKLSHSSLNHHLAVTNFLLKWYLLLGDEKAKELALRMVQGVVDTKQLWVKENKDLVYALFPNLTPHPYPDYFSLTLSDLQQTQALLKKATGTENEHLQYLINQKMEWINMQKKNLIQ